MCPDAHNDTSTGYCGSVPHRANFGCDLQSWSNSPAPMREAKQVTMLLCFSLIASSDGVTPSLFRSRVLAPWLFGVCVCGVCGEGEEVIAKIHSCITDMYIV